MEKRNITIISSRNQDRVDLQSSATTLRELKAELDAKGVDYNELSFFEGISKNELTEDDAILPSNLPWKGAITNDLVFMLTEPQKKIRNGADGITVARRKAYDFIKKHNLTAAVEKKLGRNFTRCKTVDLVKFCNAKAGIKKCAGKVIVIKKVVAKVAKCTTAAKTKKVAAKKPATKKAAVKKVATKKVAPKKPVIKKVATKKAVCKKAACKKAGSSITEKDIAKMFSKC